MGNDIDPSNNFHHVQKCVEAWGLKWRLLYPSGGGIGELDSGEVEEGGGSRSNGEMREIEK
jgi:hypothetical protein